MDQVLDLIDKQDQIKCNSCGYMWTIPFWRPEINKKPCPKYNKTGFVFCEKLG
jgi:hypothetical protein